MHLLLLQSLLGVRGVPITLKFHSTAVCACPIDSELFANHKYLKYETPLKRHQGPGSVYPLLSLSIAPLLLNQAHRATQGEAFMMSWTRGMTPLI